MDVLISPLGLCLGDNILAQNAYAYVGKSLFVDPLQPEHHRPLPVCAGGEHNPRPPDEGRVPAHHQCGRA
jgi:hypothetical protein